MRILIVTQVLDANDDVLGFMHSWVAEFARQCAEVTVIALRVGEHDLPPNVQVLSLGKESGQSRIKYLWNFYRHIIGARGRYDAVFVHMNQIYILLGGILWFVMGKRVSLWYAHGHVPFSLRIAEKLSQIIFTSTTSGFRLPSVKVAVVGQGIDTTLFVPDEKKISSDIFRIITVGRISPVKDIETLLSATRLLFPSTPPLEVIIIGGAGTPAQESYRAKLECTAKEMDSGKNIYFVGAVPNRKTLPYLQSADLFVNTSHTGSLDKAILEAMSAGLPVLTCNEALKGVLEDEQGPLMFPKGDAQVLAHKIRTLMDLSPHERRNLGLKLRSMVVTNHGLPGFVSKIIATLQKKR